jgi:hypothetical protein
MGTKMLAAAVKKIREDTGYDDLTSLEQIGVLAALLKAICSEPDDEYGQWAARMYGADAITVSEVWEIVKLTPTFRRLDVVCTLMAAWHLTNNPRAGTVIARAKELLAVAAEEDD